MPVQKQMDVVKIVRKATDDPSAFVGVLEMHNSKEDGFDAFEYVQILPKKTQGLLWDAMLEMVGSSIQRLQNAEDEESASQDLEVLFGVCLFLRSAMAQDKPVITDTLQCVLQALHDVLLMLPDEGMQLQNEISSLCETWWHCDFMKKDTLVPHSVSYLLSITLLGETSAAVIKRMYTFRQALLLLDFEDESADSLKCLLVTCFIHPSYLRFEDGRRFLSFVFGLNPSFILNIHETIKNQIPSCPKAVLDAYGEIYFRAWKASSDVYLQIIEEKCLQDLMYCAVHAPRGGLHSLFSAVRKVLGHIHQQCGQRGVTDMLYRLYKPFLWRSLKVANSDVRANAACLFLDAFPLQDNECSREERDAILQKQFDFLKELLEDPSVTVRTSAVAGVSRVLEGYWEIIPPAVIKSLLKKLIGDLARDANSVNVRVAVLQGLCIILENHLSQPVLKELLPLLGSHIHDTSERVRIALLELLILVKNMRAIKFWDIVSLEQLLLRLEMDSAPVARRIVALLMDSFQPSQQDRQQRLERCVALIRSNPTAARKFYQQALKHLSAVDIGKFILAINKCLLQVAESSEEDSREAGETSTEEDKDVDKLSIRDTVVIGGLLETVVILWEGSREEFNKESNKHIKTKLVSSLCSSVPVFFTKFQDGGCNSAVIILSSLLPYKNVSSMSSTFLEVLKTVQLTTPPSEYAPMLEALVLWDQSSSLLGLINSWLETASKSLSILVNGANEADDDSLLRNREADACSHLKKKGKNSTQKKSDRQEGNSALVQPLVAVEFTKCLLGHPLCLRELLSSKQFWRIKELLKECLFHLDSFLLSDSSSNGGVCTDTFMTELFAVYCRLVLLQATQEDKNEEAFCEDLEEILAWCGKILSSALNKSFSATENSRPKRKRKVALDAPESPHNSYTLQTTIIVLDFFSEVLLAGVFPLELRNPLSHMVASWMKSPYAPSLVQQIRKLLYQLADSWTENQMKVSSVFVDNEELLEGLLDTIRKETVTRGEEYCTKVLSEMRPVLTAAVDVSVRVYSLAVDPLYSCPPLVATITDSIVRDMEDQFRIDLSRQWPTSTDDLPCYAKRMTHFICKGGVTKRFFLSHLISIPSKPKTDLDCKSHSLMLLSVMFVVLSLITVESSLLVEDARHLSKETGTFLESLSEEHEENLSTVVDILKNGCQVLEDRASIALS